MFPESHPHNQEKWQLKDDKTLRGKEHEGTGGKVGEGEKKEDKWLGSL